MPTRRSRALTRLQSLAYEVESHVSRFVANPADSSIGHYKGEVENWLRDMERVPRHVGKKTAAKWEARIDAYRFALGE